MGLEHIVGLVVSLASLVIGGFWTVGSVAARNLYKQQEGRFDSIEATLRKSENDRSEENEKLHRIELELERIQADMPGNFVTRAEWEKSPSHADLQKLYQSIGDLSSTVNQLVGESRGQTDTLKLILNKMVNSKGEA